jgi:hypothetical protein
MPEIPATWEVEIGRIIVQGQLMQKVSKTPISINKPGRVACTCDLSSAEDINR